ncbi:MAG: copper oxidase, partial [Nitrosopumilus sp.]
MKKSHSRIMIVSISVIIAMSALYFTFTEDIIAQQEDNVFVTHSGGVIKTTGEIIDPVYSTLLDPEYTESTVEFDAMEYLREFNYGHVSQLPDGTTLREFTIIA